MSIKHINTKGDKKEDCCAELERLREENERMKKWPMWKEWNRLHRIEEAARAVVNTYEANPYVADEHLNKTEALRAALG